MAKTFYSPQMQSHKLQFDHIGSGESYRFYNFATLRSNGLSLVLDMMRYDSAFFCRKSDVDKIIECLDAKLRFALQNFSILLARFDWKGKTKPSWTPQRLMSGQEYEFITDPMALYDLGSEVTEWHIKPPAKLRSVIEVTGTPAYLLRTMHLNHAFPESEGDANLIQNGFYKPEEALTASLKTYMANEREWVFPS